MQLQVNAFKKLQENAFKMQNIFISVSKKNQEYYFCI